MANLREAFEYASKNPNSDFARNLEQLAGSGALNEEAKKFGIDLTPFQPQPVAEEKPKRTLGEKVLDFTGGKEIAQGLGQAIAQPQVAKQLEETQANQIKIQSDLLERIKQNKAQGLDTSRLENALAMITEDIQATGQGAEKILNPNELTTKQVLGDALQLGTTLGTIGGLSGTTGATKTIAGKTIPGLKVGGVQISPGLTKQAPGIATELAGKLTGGGAGTLRGAAQGGIAGLGQGVISGGLMGASQGLQEDKDLQGILKDAGTGATIGGITGGILGTIIGGISGRVKSSQLRKQILDGQISLGEKAPPDLTNLTGAKKKALDIARTQGFADEDIQFMMSMKPEDKLKAQKMISLAEKASTNKRVLERPIDVVGDSMIDRIKFIQNKNKESGKLVNQIAKSLKGQVVDANPITERASTLLDDLGITLTPEGNYNFENSVFKNIPELQNKLSKFLKQLPSGQADAYDVHIFKKSIDEIVDFGTKGEGLKGNAERVLKALRQSADDVLDNTFADYNTVNTDFKLTQDILNQANDLFGRKTGIVKERGGQLLRSVFSNNTQRPRVLKLVEDLDIISKQYGGKYTDNLLDQALFTEILEDIYGTQATTSLQGQVARAVKGTQKVIEGVRDPIKGAGELLATGAEKIAGISPENKKKILSAFVK